MKSKNATTDDITKLPATEYTNVEIGEDGVLYIRIADADKITTPSPARSKKMMENVKDTFNQAFPNTTIIVGFHDLRFTTITKKQEFIGKLDGQIKGET